MMGKTVIWLLIATFSAQAVGCGAMQSERRQESAVLLTSVSNSELSPTEKPEKKVRPLQRLRRKMIRNAEPIWDTTKQTAKYVLGGSAVVALIAGLLYVNTISED